MNNNSFYLLLSLVFWHFIADYCLSTKNMLAAKSKGWPILPIFIHGLTHALPMWAIMLNMGINSYLLVRLYVLQLVSHTLIDILKGRCNVWFPSVASPANKIHWILFGFDQFLHFAVIVAMVKIAGL